MRKLFLISLATIGLSSAAFGDTPERVHAFMVQWDLNSDGKISLAELEQEAAKAPVPAELKLDRKTAREAFKLYDLNGDGFITEPEMQETNRRAIREAAAIRKK